MPEHVSITYDHPGNCPICGMTLVPVTPGELKQLQPGGKVLYYTCPMPEHSERSRRQTGQMPDLRHDAHSGDGAAGHSDQSTNPSIHQSINPAGPQIQHLPIPVLLPPNRLRSSFTPARCIPRWFPTNPANVRSAE